MAVSDRYRTVAAVLDNPANRAIAERELARRSRPFNRGLIPPPLPREGGGVVFLTMREFQRQPRQVVPAGHDVDYLADVFEGSDGWWVSLADTSETGPFPEQRVAVETAKNLLADDGYEILNEVPWTEEDTRAFPFTSTLL